MATDAVISPLLSQWCWCRKLSTWLWLKWGAHFYESEEDGGSIGRSW